MIYWLDTNVFIQAKNKTYKFDLFPQVWAFLAEQFELGNTKCPKLVYDELTVGTDELANWCKSRKSTGMRTNSDKNVQDAYNKVATHVVTNYPPQHANVFLRGADGWVIAHAMATKGTVVTLEEHVAQTVRVKIPTVCRDLGVRCIDTYQMLTELNYGKK